MDAKKERRRQSRFQEQARRPTWNKIARLCTSAHELDPIHFAIDSERNEP